jgi:flagellar basal body-associated protein FliL
MALLGRAKGTGSQSTRKIWSAPAGGSRKIMIIMITVVMITVIMTMIGSTTIGG